MGKEGRTVYLYVDLYLSGWQRPINTRDRGFINLTCLSCLSCTPELTANASESVLWRKISDYSYPETRLRIGGKRQKTGSNRKKYRRAKQAECSFFFFFFTNADFFPLCPQYGAWSQASLQSNRENREHQKYFWNVIVLRGINNNKKKQSGVRKLNGKQER